MAGWNTRSNALYKLRADERESQPVRHMIMMTIAIIETLQKTPIPLRFSFLRRRYALYEIRSLVQVDAAGLCSIPETHLKTAFFFQTLTLRLITPLLAWRYKSAFLQAINISDDIPTLSLKRKKLLRHLLIKALSFAFLKLKPK